MWNLTCDKSECLLEENGAQTVLIPFPPTTMKIWALCCVLILDLDPTPQVTDSFKAGVMAQRLEVCLISIWWKGCGEMQKWSPELGTLHLPGGITPENSGQKGNSSLHLKELRCLTSAKK